MISKKLPLPKLLKNIETISGLHLCIKTFHQAIWQDTLLEDVPTRFDLHQTAFCRHVKQTRTRKCVQCDLQQIPQIAVQQPRPFVHRCHAGASEVIIPLILRGRLCAIGYLGQFRESTAQPPELPLFSEKETEQMIVMGTLLQRFFLYEVERNTKIAIGTNNRHLQITRFLRRNLKNDPSLTDLAKELGVSVSRAGHLVKEETGQTFSELKMQLRFDEAKEMLHKSMLTIENIARHVGFNDVRYFYRAFQKETGKSPGQWRAANRDELGA